jgi:hypothetical protein
MQSCPEIEPELQPPAGFDSARQASDTSVEAGVAEQSPEAGVPDEAAIAALDEELREALRNGSRQSKPLSSSQLIQALKRATKNVNSQHRACTSAWRTPISLFDKQAEQLAWEQNVPDWAIGVVVKARSLIEEASALYDLGDVYETQIRTALTEGRALQRGPLLDFLERCDVKRCAWRSIRSCCGRPEKLLTMQRRHHGTVLMDVQNQPWGSLLKAAGQPMRTTPQMYLRIARRRRSIVIHRVLPGNRVVTHIR